MENCYSHPDKLLIDHLTKVNNIGFGIHKKLNLSFNLGKNVFYNLLRNCLLFHDFGKATKYFQEYLSCSINNQKYNENKELTRHSLISAVYAGYKTYKETNDYKLSIICFIVILKHHGDLENIKDNVFFKDTNVLKIQYNSINWEVFKELNVEKFEWGEVESYLSSLWLISQNINFTSEDFFLIKYLYSILIYSDKNEVVFGDSLENNRLFDKITEIIPNYKNNKFKDKSDNYLITLRESFYQKSVKKIRSLEKIPDIIFINVPTGLGKTLTGLQVAFEILKKENNIERIIYAVPFTSIIDQIEENINEIFSINNLDAKEYFLKHHHLTDPKVKIDEDWFFEGEKGQFFIENWDKPLILTTFWQIFNTIFLGDNKLNRKFHKLANSLIILDEIQIVPLKYWKLIRDILLFMTEKMNCKVIYMTATIPLIFTKNEKKDSISIKLEDEEINFLDRYAINIINNLQLIKEEYIFEHIRTELNNNKNKNFLFVLNTIKESLIFFDKINELKGEDHKIYYLSTNIIPKDRKKIISEIKEKINKNEKVILISTQIIEAGVDLDFDIVYRDLAPLDSIIQTAGRCNRNNRMKGNLFLFSLLNEKGQKYSSFIYDDLSLSPTISILNNKTSFNENELIAILNNYFNEVQQRMDNNIYSKIIKDIETLNFRSVSDNFKLIEEVPDILLFIEKDEKATEILDKYKKLKEHYKGYEFKNKFLEIKGEFYEYILSKKLRKDQLNILSCFEEIGNFYLVSKELVSQFYNTQKGFLLESTSFY